MEASPVSPPKAPLEVYLQVTYAGDGPVSPWVGSLTEGGRSAAIYATSKQEMEDRAIEILSTRGITAK